MTAQVIFLNTMYQPPQDVVDKLIYYQQQYEIYHAELAYKMKGLSRGEQYLYKERSHNAVRDTWKIYTGFKDGKELLDRVK